MLSPKSSGSTSLRHPDEFSDDSVNHSDDDAILTECIQSAMPKVVTLKLKTLYSFKPDGLCTAISC